MPRLIKTKMSRFYDSFSFYLHFCFVFTFGAFYGKSNVQNRPPWEHTNTQSKKIWRARNALARHKKLSQKSVYDFLLGFLFSESESHKLDKLLARDLSDRRLVNQRSIRVYRKDLGDRRYRCRIHYDRIALGVSRATVIALDARYKFLM